MPPFRRTHRGQLKITPAAAKAILAERGHTVSQLRMVGRIDLKPGVYLTLTGKCTYTLVDVSSAEGEGIADVVPEYDRPMVPACQPDSEGTLEQRLANRRERDRDASVRNMLLHG